MKPAAPSEAMKALEHALVWASSKSVERAHSATKARDAIAALEARVKEMEAERAVFTSRATGAWLRENAPSWVQDDWQKAEARLEAARKAYADMVAGRPGAREAMDRALAKEE